MIMNRRLINILGLVCICALAFCQSSAAQNKTKRPSYKVLAGRNAEMSTRIDSLQNLVLTLTAERDARKQEADSLREAASSAADRLEDVVLFHGPVPDSLLVFGPEIDDTAEVERFTSDVSDSVLVQRLAAMNSMVSLPYNSTVRSYMVKYSEKWRGHISRMLGEAKYYFPIYESVLANYDLPQELKYMSVIESAFKTQARSSAGARGLWQFMYFTAQKYGLNIDSYVDERMDTYKATDAAARYMKDAYDTLGDWSLAIASYNCGPQNVLRAIKKAGKSDFWSIYPYLPRETRGYLPAFVGVMYAMEYCKEYGIEADDAPFSEPIDAILIDRKLHFRQLNEVLGVPMDLIETLNSQYIHGIIPASPDKKYTLLLPHSWMEEFEAAEPDSVYNYKAEELFVKAVQVGRDDAQYRKYSGSKSSGRGTVTYTVKSGDTLGKIARKYGVSVDKIKKANKLNSDIIRTGRKLVIPR